MSEQKLITILDSNLKKKQEFKRMTSVPNLFLHLFSFKTPKFLFQRH
jgi:hypothetical protein